MSEIPIYEYLNAIDELLDNNQLTEAAAHCRHILQQHPRHVETYRLLGKVLLEQQAFEDAGDILRRVLSADPEDFIAHVGLAIVYKEEDAVPEAIWHMERAFDIDPYNAAIQDELRDLYAHRDGMAPERISLTRGALARLYARGDLYQQAVAELRQALAEDETRVDLRVLLAEVLLRDDQRVEAVEICLDLLRVLPNCIKANAILAEVWLSSGRAEEAEEYLQRLLVLELPDQLHCDAETPVGRAFNAEGAPALRPQIMVDKLVYQRAAPDGDGFSLEETPDWVMELGKTDPAQAGDWLSDIGAADADDDEQVMDWLRETAMGQEAAAVDEEDGQEIDDQPAESEFGAADESEALPDWLSDVLLTGTVSETAGELAGGEAAAVEDEPAANEEDDMAGLFAEDIEEAGPADQEGGVPDWLRDLDRGEPVEEADGRLEIDTSELESADLPDWLREAEMTADSETTGWDEEHETAAGGSEIVALGDEIDSAMAEEVTERQMMGDDQEPRMGQDEFEDDDDGMAWLEELANQQETSSQAATDPDDDEAGKKEADDSLEWLDAVTGGEEQLPDWLQAEGDSAPEDDLPDWLSEPVAGDDEQPVATETGEETDEDLPDWLTEMSPEDGVEAMPAEDLPDWLTEMASEDMAGDQSEAVVDSVADDLADEIPAENLPDWLTEMASEDVAAYQSEDVVDSVADDLADEIPAENLPDWLTEMASEDVEETMARTAVDAGEAAEEAVAGAPDGDMEDVAGDGSDEFEEDISWLDELAAGEGDVFEEPPTLTWDDEAAEVEEMASDEVLEMAPDEMEEMASDEREEAAAIIEPQVEEAAVEEEDLPDWLQELEVTAEVDAELMETALAEEADEMDTPADFDDMDDAMAWLEQLAARQGAPLDELPTMGVPDETAAAPTMERGEIEAEAAAEPELAVESEDGPEPAEPERPADGEDEPTAAAAAEVEPAMRDQVPPAEMEAAVADAEADEPDDFLAVEMETAPAEEEFLVEAEAGDDEVPEDLDDAMAWLEQLAARQGAPLDELPTVSEAPTAVAEEPADTADEVVESTEPVEAETETAVAETTGEETVQLDETAGISPETAAGEEATVAAEAEQDEVPEDLDDAMAWLEQLAARQGADLDELPTVSERPVVEEVEEVEAVEPEMADELDAAAEVGDTSLDELEDEMPHDPDEAMAWLEELAARQDADLEQAGIEPGQAQMDVEVDDIEELDEALQAAVTEYVPDLSGDELDDMPDDPDLTIAWLEQLAAGGEPRPADSSDDISFEDVEASDESEVEATPDEIEPEEAAPQTVEAEAEAAAVAMPSMEEELSSQDISDSLPDWLGFGDEEADEEFAWMDESPADVGDWLAAEDKAVTGELERPVDDKMATGELSWAAEEIDEVVASEEKAQEPDSEEVFEAAQPEISTLALDEGAMTEARRALAAGDEAGALAAYQALLDAGEGLTTLIAELERVVAEQSRRPLLRRMLGDVYMRNGQLQKALDAYRQALNQL